MVEHTHILQGDVVGCPSCDRVHRRPVLTEPAPLPAAPPAPDLSGYPEATHRIRDGRFICDGDENSRCHQYPGDECEHEGWPCGHEYRSHAECWVAEYVIAADLDDSYGGEIGRSHFPDGPATWSWEGDYVLWEYVDEGTRS